MGDIKIFKLDDYAHYAAHSLMVFLNWYHRNVASIISPDDLDELEIINPEDGMMWSNLNITPEDIERIGDADEYGTGKNAGDLLRRDDKILKLQTYADVLNVLGEDDIKEPFEISTSEW